MNYFLKVSLILFVFVGSVYYAPAQSRELTEQDVIQLRDDAAAIIETMSYREKIVALEFTDKTKTATVTRTTTKVFVPPSDTHTTFVTEDVNGTRTAESIWLDPVEYAKSGNEPWRIVQHEPESYLSYGVRNWGTVTKNEVTINHSTNEKLGNVKTDYYQISRKIKYGETIDANENYSVLRYWFNKNGTLAKSEEQYSFKTVKEFYSTTKVYEYDAKLKIEAPSK